MLPQIFTAIEFDPNQDDVKSMVTQPLLFDDITLGDEERQAVSPSASKCKTSRSSIVILGIMTGFFIQVISLGAYAFMLSWYGEESLMISTEGKEDPTDWYVYGLLSVLTQVDLVIYVLIWVAFTCTMTKPGMELIRQQCQANIKRRFIFVMGVYFLVGIVLGAFVAWTMIDLFLGLPISFTPIAATVLVDLVLCYLMFFCYDLGRDRELVEDEAASTCC